MVYMIYTDFIIEVYNPLVSTIYLQLSIWHKWQINGWKPWHWVACMIYRFKKSRISKWLVGFLFPLRGIPFKQSEKFLISVCFNSSYYMFLLLLVLLLLFLFLLLLLNWLLCLVLVFCCLLSTKWSFNFFLKRVKFL